jgi:D-sedoheptulose 7-phosphate isomerase
METLSDILKRSGGTPREFSGAYLKYIGSLLANLDSGQVAGLIERLEQARRDSRTVFVIGNGGSAATASHMANDLGLCGDDTNGGPLRVLALTDGIPLMTAIANDSGYERIFVRQLEVHYRPGDVLIAISASGNSPNLLVAAEWVKGRGGEVIGLLGFDGGRLNALCDHAVVVRTATGEYGPVEDVHMVLDHLLMTWFARARFMQA